MFKIVLDIYFCIRVVCNCIKCVESGFYYTTSRVMRYALPLLVRIGGCLRAFIVTSYPF